ncbi:MAG TPA: EamA family transporter [Pirellula sp.]|nr:EamA family transporter [Pirellula sp.]
MVSSSEANSKPSLWLVALGLATVYLVWGSTYLAIRVAVQTMPPFLMASTRFLVAGAILATILVGLKRFRINRQQLLDNTIIGAFLLLGGNGLVSWAQQEVPSGMTTLILSLNPLFVVVADWAVLLLFRDRQRGAKPNILTFFGLALGFAGLSILVGPPLVANDSTYLDAYRVLGLVAASLSWCIGSLYTRYAKNSADPFSGAAVQMLLGGFWLLVVSILFGEPFRTLQISTNSMLAWIYLMLMGSLVTFTTFIWLMKHASPSLVSTYSYVNPIVAVFLGWFVLDEPVSPRIFVAGAVIVLGVATITFARSQKPKKDLVR